MGRRAEIAELQRGWDELRVEVALWAAAVEALRARVAAVEAAPGSSADGTWYDGSGVALEDVAPQFVAGNGRVFACASLPQPDCATRCINGCRIMQLHPANDR
jgi:hypothetical protein